MSINNELYNLINCNCSRNVSELLNTELHKHNEIEIIFCDKGEIFVGDNLSKIKLSEGDIALIPPNTYHFILCLNYNVILYSIKFPINILTLCKNQFLFITTIRTYRSEDLIKIYKPITKLFKKTTKTFGIKNPASYLLTQSYILQILSILMQSPFKEFQINDTTKGFNNVLAEKIENYVNENYSTVNLKEISSFFSMSYYYFSRNFTKKFKIPFSVYLQNIKLEKAEELLINTDISITEIAGMIGFSTSSLFIKCFKDKNQISPMQYRLKINS